MTTNGLPILFVATGVLVAVCIFEQGPSNAWHRRLLKRHSDSFWGAMMHGLLMFSWLGVIIQLLFWALAWIAPLMSRQKQARHDRLNPPMPEHDEVRAESFPFRT